MIRRADAPHRLLLCAVVLGACVRTAPRPAVGYRVSSDSSHYSPAATFWMASSRLGSDLLLAIDSGMLAVPGATVADPPPLMSSLYLTAVVATTDSASLNVVRPGAGRRPAERRGWRPVVSSDSVLLVDVLHYGERRAFSAVRLTVRHLPSASAAPLWVIFRISGNTVELSAPLEAGVAPRRRDLIGGVQVYACGDRDLDGRFDASRMAELKREYSIAC
jgi:hypothetical protein